MAWTDERVAELKKLWKEGLSCTQIAEKLGVVSRNAVIGKVHRLGLSGRAAPSVPSRSRVKKLEVRRAPDGNSSSRQSIQTKASASKKVVDPVESKAFAGGNFRTVETIRSNECRWPVGDPSSENFHFCGRKTGDGQYCDEHASIAFQAKRSSGTGGARAALDSIAARGRFNF